MPKVLHFSILIIFITSTLCSSRQEFTLFTDYHNPINVLFSSPPNEVSLAIAPDSEISLSNPEQTILKYDPLEDVLETPYSIKGGSDVIFKNDLLFGDTKQWKLYHIEDFQGSAEGWSHNVLSTCGSSTDLFLGGHCNFANQVVTKTFSDLPTHEMVRVKFNFHFFGSWSGQSAYALLDDKYIWQESYNWCTKVLPWYCKKYGVFACGLEYPERLSYPVEYTGQHSGSTLKFSVSTNLDNDPCQASWGIDDVQIYFI